MDSVMETPVLQPKNTDADTRTEDTQAPECSTEYTNIYEIKERSQASDRQLNGSGQKMVMVEE